MATDNVDGYSAADPVLDEDWEDVVRWEVNYVQAGRHEGHNRDGWFAHEAGSAACLALGHEPDPDYGWEYLEGHESGWEGEPLCQATTYGTACTECQSEDCPWEPADPEILWGKVRA